jgi:superfamily II DNA or RNA helicase
MFEEARKGRSVRMPELRPHQRDAVEALTAALAGGGRAQVVMAMGTGKTLVGRAAADRLVPGGGTVAVLVPSLALVFQTLRVWREAGGLADVLAVCSADDPGEAGAHAEDGDDDGAVPVPAAGGAQPVETTTDPSRIAAWLGVPAPGAGMRLLLATYHSVARIARGYGAGGGLPPLDLVVFDEAHRAAADPEMPFATALHDGRVPAVRRLFLTATPRLQAGLPGDPRAAEVFPGMGDEKLFGGRVYELTVGAAIERKLLSDYRVAVIGVSDSEVRKLVLERAPLLVGPEEADARAVAIQIAVARAAREYGLRRVLVFHNRVASSRDFAGIFPHVLGALPAGTGPDGTLTVHHVDAFSPAGERERALAGLSDPEPGGWTVVSNVRVLAEGIDCPALDAVVFADPRKSQTGTVQAVGRALRLHPDGDRPAVILIPVYLAPGESGELAAEDSEFRSVWQILRVLRDRDARIGAQLIAVPRDLALARGGDPGPVLPDWLGLRLPSELDDSFASAFTTRLLGGTSRAVHEHGLARLRAFADENGHSSPASHHVDETGFKLGKWVSARRRDQASGVLDLWVAAELEAMPGWTWSIPRAYADRMLDALRDYAAGHGNTRPPYQYVTADGATLGVWVFEQRTRYREGTLSPRTAAALEQVPGWNWLGAKDERWEAGLEHLRAFAAECGHADVGGSYVSPDGYDLGRWVSFQRQWRRRLTGDRVRALEEVPGWEWTRSGAHRERMLAEVARYYAAHGPGPVPRDYRPGHDPGLPVGPWVERMVGDHAAGRMAPELAVRLEAIPGFAWGHKEAGFGDVMRRLAEYAAAHGVVNPPAGFVTGDGYQLGEQVRYLRKRYRAGQLPAGRVRALEGLPGWQWGTGLAGRARSEQERFEAMARALRAYAAEHGTCIIPPGVEGPGGGSLQLWTKYQRQRYQQGRLAQDRVATLEAIPGWRWKYFTRRSRGPGEGGAPGG